MAKSIVISQTIRIFVIRYVMLCAGYTINRKYIENEIFTKLFTKIHKS